MKGSSCFPNANKGQNMTEFVIVGRGGREHALAEILGQAAAVFSFAGSDAIRHVAPPLDEGMTVALDRELGDAALSALLSRPGSIIVFGPEQPMAVGWVDQIRIAEPDRLVLGPSQFAAQLETSKWWAKEFMVRNGVPTGAAERIKSVDDFERFTLQFEPPYVIKADGLAAGKGVAIFDQVGPARAFVDGIVSGDLFGRPQPALIEEFLAGPELSVFLLLDGDSALQMGMARDYKRAFDDDQGPNTGGMGSFTPVPDISADDQRVIDQRILRPILDGLRREQLFYRGFLYVGLIRTERGFRVLEFNVRMGDPETQALLPTLGTRAAVWFEHAACGELNQLADDMDIEAVAPNLYRFVSAQAAVCVVVAAESYPQASLQGERLSADVVPPACRPAGGYIFHAGTRCCDGDWYADGGRILNVVATADRLDLARQQCYILAQEVVDLKLRMRRDIAAF